MKHAFYLLLPLTVAAILTVPMSSQTVVPNPPVTVEAVPGAAAPKKKATHELREFAIGDLENLRLNAFHGNLQFTAGGVEYVYYPRKEPNSTPGEDVIACTAVLGELRNAIKLTVGVRVDPPELPADRKKVTVSEFSISLPKLR
jgi:hypothetical protein